MSCWTPPRPESGVPLAHGKPLLSEELSLVQSFTSQTGKLRSGGGRGLPQVA